MKRYFISFLLIILLLITFHTSTLAKESLLVYSAAGLIKPMEVITEQFKTEYDLDIHLQFNGSGVLKNQIETVKKGDIYIAADSWYLKDLAKKSIVKDYYNIASHTPVIILPKNSNKEINKLRDLLKEDIKVVVADPSAAIGRVTEEIIKKNKLGDNFYNNIISKAETVNKVRMYIIMGQGDAGIVWRANYFESKDKLKLIEIADENNIIKDISMGILKYSSNKKQAQLFIDYLRSKTAKEVFKSYGYDISEKR